MYLDCKVEVPNEPEKISFITKGNTVYVRFVAERIYKSDKKYTSSNHKIIGKLIDEKRRIMVSGMKNIYYIIAISFQVTGALLLLINSVSTRRDDVITRFVGKGLLERDNNTDEIYYNEDSYKEEYKLAYVNKIAFAYIALGYFIGALIVTIDIVPIVCALGIMIMTLFLLFVTIKSVNIIVDNCKVIQKKITNEDLQRLDLKPHIENISNDEIDEICQIMDKL